MSESAVIENATISVNDGTGTNGLPEGTSFTVSAPFLDGMNGDPVKLATEVGEKRSLPTWEGVIAYEGLETVDGRYLMPGEIDERELPLTLMAQMVTEPGHDGAEIAGKITKVWRTPREDLGKSVVAIMASGEFSSEEKGPVAALLVEDEVLRGVSIDFAPTEVVPIHKDTHEVIDEKDLTIEMLMAGEVIAGMKGTILGATLVPFPAFGEAQMWIAEEDAALVASAAMDTWKELGYTKVIRLAPVFDLKTVEPMVALTAAAAGVAPLAPPREWFYTPETSSKTPLTITPDGRVYGHLATWDQCHMGLFNDCILAKPSRTNYGFFHTGQIRTSEGDTVPIGRVIVGDAGHANVYLEGDQAAAFYDKTGLVAAFVRAVDGQHGIWLSGAVRSDCPAEKVRDLMANPPSGDWRWENSWLELIAALAVPVPGFPVPYAEVALCASAAEDGIHELGYENVRSLVASGYVENVVPTLSRSEQRQKALLVAEASEALA